MTKNEKLLSVSAVIMILLCLGFGIFVLDDLLSQLTSCSFFRFFKRNSGQEKTVDASNFIETLQKLIRTAHRKQLEEK